MYRNYENRSVTYQNIIQQNGLGSKQFIMDTVIDFNIISYNQ